MIPDGGTWWRSPGWPIPAWVHTNAPYLTHCGLKVSEMLLPNVPPLEMRSPPPRIGLGFISTTVGQAGNGSAPMPQFYYGGAGGGPIETPIPASGGGPGPAPVSGPSVAPITPIWYDVNNNIITSAICGSIYSMTIPGYEGKTVYIIQTKNGVQNFAGNMAIPMVNYASVCNQDEGSYQVTAYDLTGGGFIGQGSFSVLPTGTPAPPPQAGSSTGTTGATTPAAQPGTVPTAPAPAQAVGMTPSATATTTTMPATTTTIAGLSAVDWILIAAVVIALVKK